MKVVLITTDESPAAIGVRTLSACLREQGIETQIVLMPTQSHDYNGFCWDVLLGICQGASLFGISAMSHAIPKAIEVKEFLKKNFDVPIIIGGIHAMLDPASLMPDFDLICHGEGEDLIVELASRIKQNKDYSDVPGLWIKSEEKFIKNKSLPLKRILNDYPFPDYDFSHQYVLNASRLVPMEASRQNIMSDGFIIMGSRGCPHQCSYCCNKALKEQFPWMHKVRHYSTDYLIAHIKEANKRFPGINRFWIEDDTFFVKGLTEINEFAQRYKKEIAKPFYILISPWTFNQEKLTILIEAGMNAIIMGIQSGSENTNTHIYNRKIPNARLLEIIRKINQYPEILPYYDFIGMNPYETAADLTSTIRFISSIPSPFFLFNNNLAFYPGTGLYACALKENRPLNIRRQHSSSLVGYKILFHEPMNHKLFHYVLLLMAGRAGGQKIGKIPRVFLKERSLRIYLWIDKWIGPLINTLISILAGMVLLAARGKKGFLVFLQKTLGMKHYSWLRNVFKKH